MRIASCKYYTRALISLLLSVIILAVFCEFIAYYIIMLKCTWPALTNAHFDKYVVRSEEQEPRALKVMILSDPHIVPKTAHPINRIHEWNMERSFRAVLFIHRPDLVFILGDIMDTGNKATESEFKEYVERFKSVFPYNPNDTSQGYKLKVVVGNHDIGFHYDVTRHKDRRFRRSFYGDVRSTSGRIYSEEGVHFVLLNSVSFEGDQCDLCVEGERDLESIAKRFRCIRGDDADPSLDCSLTKDLNSRDRVKYHYDLDSDDLKPGYYSRPIVLQHYPLFRRSDSLCPSKPLDAMPQESRNDPMRPKWDCLSKNASERIVKLLQPRLVVSGHTHHSCIVEHRINSELSESVPEWSVASFSTRNLVHPSFLMMRVTPYDYSINKCYTPSKFATLYLYICGLLIIIAYHTSAIAWMIRSVKRLYSRRTDFKGYTKSA